MYGLRRMFEYVPGTQYGPANKKRLLIQTGHHFRTGKSYFDTMYA